MIRKHTYCFRYRDLDRNICYAWIEAISEGAAKLKFENEVSDCVSVLEIRETFNW